MDLSKLALVSTENLMKMQDTISAILATRLDTELRIGRTATFTDNKGVLRTVRITRINGKTASCVEIGKSANPGGTWRVTKSALKVEPVERSTPKPFIPKTPLAPHRPNTQEKDCW